MTTPAPLLLNVKAVAVAVADLERARRFYRDTLGLRPAADAGEPDGFHLGAALLLLKSDWYGRPTAEPNPRITLETADARTAEATLRQRGVSIADPVAAYGAALVGSFLDSEGNKLWFCSRVPSV